MTGEVKDEFLKCVFKGLIEAGDWTDEEKALRKDMLDKFFATKDFVTIPSDTFQGVTKLLDGDTVEALADFFGAGSDTVERYTEHEKFDDVLTRSSELFSAFRSR